MTRRLRLRGVWLLVPPYFYFARPSATSLIVGGALIAAGLAVRAWAAGVLHKDKVLSTSGPYAHTRNPLYVGTFLLGLGAVVAAAHPIFAAAFLVLFVVIYGRTMRDEANRLEDRFGDEYRRFAKAVPLFIPRLTPAGIGDVSSSGFDATRWKANREYEALMGAVAVLALLALKLAWLG